MTENNLVVLPDVQSSADRRNIPIERVGVKGIRTPCWLSRCPDLNTLLLMLKCLSHYLLTKKGPTCPVLSHYLIQLKSLLLR